MSRRFYLSDTETDQLLICGTQVSDSASHAVPSAQDIACSLCLAQAWAAKADMMTIPKAAISVFVFITYLWLTVKQHNTGRAALPMHLAGHRRRDADRTQKGGFSQSTFAKNATKDRVDMLGVIAKVELLFGLGG